MKRLNSKAPILAAAVAGILVVAASDTQAATRTWANVGTDWNDAANWDTGVPGTGDVAVLVNNVGGGDPAVLNPNMSASTTVTAVQMDVSGSSHATGSLAGWNVSADPGVAITLTGTGSTINSTSTALRSYARDTGARFFPITFAPDIILAPSSGTQSTFATPNDPDGAKLSVTGTISETTLGTNLNLYGGGSNFRETIELSGANTFTGDLIASANAAVTSIGNKGEASAAGAGNRIVIGQSSSVGVSLDYLGGAKTTDRDFHLGAGGAAKSLNHRGTGLLKFTGAVTVEGFTSPELTMRVSDAGGAIEFENGFANDAFGTTRMVIRENLGTIILSGANTFGANVAGGDLQIGFNAPNTGGLVLVNGSLAANANVDIRYGTLGGDGDGITTGLVAGAVQVGTGISGVDNYEAILAPGNSIGHLTVGSATFGVDGLLDIELDDVGAGSSDGTTDLLSVVGLLDLSSGGQVDFAATGTLNDTAYVFAEYGSLSGTFALESNVPAGYSLDYNYLGGNQIALVLVPEPASIGLLAMTGLGLLRRRRA